MRLIGLTGGIGTGKSTVSRYLEQELRIPVVDADKIAREVVEPGKPAYREIVKHFGTDILLPSGALDRETMGKLIFGDEAKRKLLNRCTHPYIRREILCQIVVLYLKLQDLVVLDAPLLIESGLHRICSSVIVVYCDEEKQETRLSNRNPELSLEAVRQRINAQMPIAEKITVATHVIDNNGTIEETLKHVESVIAQDRPSQLVTLFWWCIPMFIGSLCVGMALGGIKNYILP